ncbi:glycogen branching enzyme [Haemophilus influenzae]|uniref:Glycogen branching enzyme n=1 Tax=Haemophilus influenzae TaxID=727 RepID=A0A2X1PUN8_HAEIF|nr:glycogen branching enzyme [Haemophilus influenzae]
MWVIFGYVASENIESHGRENSISVSIPPLATVYLRLKSVE